MKFHPLAVCAVAAFAGCTQYLPSVGPSYKAPDDPIEKFAMPDAGAPTTNLTASLEYKAAEKGEDDRIEVSNDTMALWWRRFDDDVLAGLVTDAVSNNVSFKMAQSRLEQANWELLGTYSAFLPKANLGASWSHDVYRGNNVSLASSKAYSKRYEAWNLGSNFDWEIDIFGGSRRQTESYIALAEAANWEVADAWLALTTQIGRQYVNLRTTQALLDVARTNLILQSETLDILTSRLSSGIGDELAVNQCAYIVEQTRARIPTLLAQEEAYKNSLAILAGDMPGAWHEALAAPKVPRDWLLAPQKISELPLDMMRGRPDVRRAERQLAAQCARIGVAKAQWFPRLFITGSIGVESTKWRSLFDYQSVYSSFGPSISWPIFQAGAIYSSVKAEEAKTQTALLNYEHALEEAYAEIRNNYAAYTQEYYRYKSLVGAVKAATDAVTISQDLYKNGLKDFNNVLDAQRSRLQLEEELVDSRGQITLYLIALYKSLGGGLAATDVNADENAASNVR